MNLSSTGRAAGGVALRQKCACAIAIAAYFFYFVADTVKVHFAPDDMMNMALYYRLPPGKLLLQLFMPWRGFYRPLAGLYYLPIHHFFGLDPAPFHIVLMLLLLGGIYLVYELGLLLGAGNLTSLLAALILCFHAGVANLYYNTAFIYDVLCGLFYLGALVYYMRIREEGRALKRPEAAAFLALFLLALDAKEMGVTLPVVVLLYEVIYRRPGGPEWRNPLSWLRAPGLAVTLSIALDALYCYGKAFGAGALMNEPAYRPVFSLARWESFQTRSLSELLLSWGGIEMRAVVLLWFLVFYLSLRLNRPLLWFCCGFVALTPLPIEFLEGRGGACLYIPLIGWALFAAAIFREVVHVLTRVLAGDPVLRHLGAQSIAALLIVSGMSGWAIENHRLKQSFVQYSMAELGRPTWNVIQQFAALHPQVRPHSTVVFLNDPFEGYDVEFIAELWFRDRSLDIRLDRKTPFSCEELARADYVFTFAGGKLAQVR